MPHFDFIEIGTSDSATLIGKATPTMRGISVEPVRQYLDRLPNRPLVIKVNAAISNVSGMTNIHYVPDAVRIAHGLPSWMKGTNSIGAPHPTVVRHLTRKGLPLNLIVAEPVAMISLTDLFAQYEVESVDYLKIDTEGHDTVIMNMLLDTLTVKPRRIRFESNCLSDKAAVTNICSRLIALGYSIRQTQQDTYATLGD